MTCRLQGGRSANWAMSAQWDNSIRAHHYNRRIFLVKQFWKNVTMNFLHPIPTARKHYTTGFFKYRWNMTWEWYIRIISPFVPFPRFLSSLFHHILTITISPVNQMNFSNCDKILAVIEMMRGICSIVINLSYLIAAYTLHVLQTVL